MCKFQTFSTKIILKQFESHRRLLSAAAATPLPLWSLCQFCYFMRAVVVAGVFYFSRSVSVERPSLLRQNSVACLRIDAIILTSYVNCFDTFASRLCVFFRRFFSSFELQITHIALEQLTKHHQQRA